VSDNCSQTVQSKLDELTSKYIYYITLHITLETIYSGLSTSNFKDHYGDAAK